MAFQTMNLLLVPPGDGRGSRALAPAASLGLKTQKEPLLSQPSSEEGLQPLRGDPLAWGRHGCSQWHRAMGWGDVVVPGHPICRAAPGASSSPLGQPGPSDPRWDCADAEQSSDEVRGEERLHLRGQRGLRWCYSKLVLIT